ASVPRERQRPAARAGHGLLARAGDLPPGQARGADRGHRDRRGGRSLRRAEPRGPGARDRALMRFALAALVAGALDLAVLLKVDQWIGAGAFLAIGYLLVASAGAGVFAARRGALAGALAVAVGALLSALVQYWPRLGYAPDAGTLIAFEIQLVIAL